MTTKIDHRLRKDQLDNSKPTPPDRMITSHASRGPTGSTPPQKPTPPTRKPSVPTTDARTLFSVLAEDLQEALKSLKPASYSFLPIVKNMLVIEPEDSRIRLWTLDNDWNLTESFVRAVVTLDAPAVVEFSTLKELSVLSVGRIDFESDKREHLGECLVMKNGGSISRMKTRPYADLPALRLDEAVAWASVEKSDFIRAVDFVKRAAGKDERLEKLKFEIIDNNLVLSATDSMHANIAQLPIVSQAENLHYSQFTINPKALDKAITGWKKSESSLIHISLISSEKDGLTAVVFTDGEERAGIHTLDKGADLMPILAQKPAESLLAIPADSIVPKTIKAFKAISESADMGGRYIGQWHGFTLSNWAGDQRIEFGPGGIVETCPPIGISLEALEHIKALGALAEQQRKAQKSKAVDNLAVFIQPKHEDTKRPQMAYVQWGNFTVLFTIPSSTAKKKESVNIQPAPAPVVVADPYVKESDNPRPLPPTSPAPKPAVAKMPAFQKVQPAKPAESVQSPKAASPDPRGKELTIELPEPLQVGEFWDKFNDYPIGAHVRCVFPPVVPHGKKRPIKNYCNGLTARIVGIMPGLNSTEIFVQWLEPKPEDTYTHGGGIPKGEYHQRLILGRNEKMSAHFVLLGTVDDLPVYEVGRGKSREVIAIESICKGISFHYHWGLIPRLVSQPKPTQPESKPVPKPTRKHNRGGMLWPVARIPYALEDTYEDTQPAESAIIKVPVSIEPAANSQPVKIDVNLIKESPHVAIATIGFSLAASLFSSPHVRQTASKLLARAASQVKVSVG